MMRSLYSGISGLRNHQTRMDVIANNISNVNTTGFVASRVVFKDVFSQTSSYATGSSNTKGGTNPIQIGLGMTLATIDMMMTSSTSFARSDRPLDLSLNGDGFFVVNIDGSTSSPQLRYTRTGNLYWDNDGNLVTGDGYFVQGVMLDPPVCAQDPDDSDDYATAKATPPIAAADIPEGYGGWDIRSLYSGTASAMVDDSYDPALEDRTDPSQIQNIVGTGYVNMAIDGNGIITGIDENGVKCAIGYLVMGTFMNSNGLEKVGNSLYQASNNSGPAALAAAGTFGAGEIMTGGLEMSNVELASEFTDMIVTQRGFQANSRIITTSDSMLEELVNLKR